MSSYIGILAGNQLLILGVYAPWSCQHEKRFKRTMEEKSRIDVDMLCLYIMKNVLKELLFNTKFCLLYTT
jgi:hypothetical protein